MPFLQFGTHRNIQFQDEGIIHVVDKAELGIILSYKRLIDLITVHRLFDAIQSRTSGETFGSRIVKLNDSLSFFLLSELTCYFPCQLSAITP